MGKTIYISEAQVREVQEELVFQAFWEAVQTFLRQLVANPADTKVPEFFDKHGITSDALIAELIASELLNRTEKIDDKNGVKGMMVVKYIIPAANYTNLITPHALYTKLFKSDSVNEVTTTCSCGGMAYYAPVGFDSKDAYIDDDSNKPGPGRKRNRITHPWG